MNFTLHQLQIFLKISELQSITKASEELFLTQPAVSIQLKKFQEQFSIPLTEVVGRQLFITDFGKEIAQAAKKILEEVNAINYKTMAYQGQLAGKLKFSVVSTGKYVMPYFLSGFMHQNRGVDLSMDVTNKTKVVKQLERNEVDFALVSVIPGHLEDKLDRIELMQNKLYFVGSKKLDRDPKMPVKKLIEQFPLLYREEGSATRNAMEQFIAKNDFPTYKKMELTSNEALKQAVLAGLGYSIMPLIGIKNAIALKNLEIIPYKGLPIITNWNLVWLRAKNLSPAALAFLSYLRQEKAQIIEESFKWIDTY